MKNKSLKFGFFSKLFGRKAANSEHNKAVANILKKEKIVKKGNFLFSNAPQDWRKLYASLIITSGDLPKQNWMMTGLSLLGEINTNLEKALGQKVESKYADTLHNFAGKNATSFCVEILLDDGLFGLDGIVMYKGKRIPVTIYREEVSPKEIAQLDETLQKEGYEPLVWFSVYHPNDSVPIKPLQYQVVSKSFFQLNTEKQGIQNRTHDSYAMWWPSEKEKDFCNSTTRKNIDLFMKSFDKYESYGLGLLGYYLGIKEKVVRTALPPIDDEVILQGPEGVEIIMSLSINSGICFHIPAKDEFEQYRNRFYKAMADWAVEMKQGIIEEKLDQDNLVDDSAYEWFSAVCENYEVSDDESKMIGLLEQ